MMKKKQVVRRMGGGPMKKQVVKKRGGGAMKPTAMKKRRNYEACSKSKFTRRTRWS